MSKRRRSVTSDFRDDDPPATSTPSAKKRKRSVTQTIDQADICQELYDTIRNYKDDDGRLLCESFVRVPKRRSLPDYYDVVTTPIDLLKVQQKLKMDEYETIDQLTHDIELMINNTKAYFKKESQEYQDACDLMDLYVETKNEILEENEELGGEDWEEEEVIKESSETKQTEKSADQTGTVSENTTDISDEDSQVSGGMSEDDGNEPRVDSGGDSDYAMDNPDNPYEQLFTAVMMHKGSNARYTSLLFRKLPARSAYPEYYDVINNPIDMKIIAKKIKNEQYTSLHALEKDFLLMVKNAKTFNEPGSQVYKDACTLKKIITGKKLELERQARDGQTPSKSSERIKARQSSGQNALSAITAALQISSDEEEEIPYPLLPMEYEEGDESGTDSFLADGGDPLHILFETIVNYRNAMGQLVAEPFMRLPNSRAYPDYYEEINRPLAISKIRSRLKSGKYTSMVSLENDFNLVFNNAKQYNMSNSRLYKDADRLQRVMELKKKELGKLEVKKEDESMQTGEDEAEEKTKKRRSTLAIAPPVLEEKKPKEKEIMDAESPFRKRLMALYKMIEDYQDGNGRYLTDIFMEKPSKKLYPDYYQVISEPIDMVTIENNIIIGKYSTETDLVADFKLMFNNARHYNEEDSQVYRDADTLEELLLNKVRDLGPLSLEVTPIPKSKSIKKVTPKKTAKTLTPLAQKLKDLYDAINNYKDSYKRVLSSIFQRLPSKNEYPEYYQVIKKPIDLQKIYQRMTCSQYETLDDMVADFLLMFDNACKFNEPDSQIYKDALKLQRVLLQKNAELMSDESSGVPDVQMLVREIMTNLYVSVVNHQDEEGRCYSDSLAEISATNSTANSNANNTEKDEGPVKKPLDLDVVRRNLDRGRYRRLDRFQDDMFEVFETARKLSRTDSQVYEDAVELQKFLITIRDEICKNGELLLSPALSYTHKHHQNDLDKERKEKLPKEMKEDQEKREEEKRLQEIEAAKQNEQSNLATDGVDVKGQTYRVGDFVYLEPLEKNLKPHIVLIEKLWADDNGEQWLHGNWFYRPDETFHLATRKFLQKEVFKSDYYNSAKVSRVMGKCYVMFVKDYFKTKPEGFAEEDVYACESRYNAKAKCFKKIKCSSPVYMQIWSIPTSSAKIIPREEPLSKVRVASVFADQIHKQEEPIELDQTDVLDKEREDVECDVTNPDEGSTYYEQLNIESGFYKLGDCVYLRSDEDKPYLARIDRMWKDKNGDPWFHGPWYVHPSETEHPPTRMFYKNEVFLSSIEDTNPMRSISGKCAVLAFKDYLSCRPTEHGEDDVYVCESRYNEAERQIRKLKGLKKFSLSNKVIDDEMYFLRKQITPLKEPSPLLQKVSEQNDEEAAEQQDVKDVTEHVEKVEPPPVVETPVKPKAKRTASGYILFASEIRSQLKHQYPDYSFGELSRVIGTEWKNLEPKQKAAYEERAAIQAAAKEEAARNEAFLAAESPAQSQGPPPGTMVVYECGWADCDFQFEDIQDLTNHLLENSGHLRILGDQPEYPCMWRSCPRNRKVNQPFPQIARLIRHCKEVHLRVAAKHIYPNQRSRNFFTRQALRGGLQSASPGPGGRPVTPGSGNAMMGIVGPPTPVGMVTHAGGLNNSMQGMQGGMHPNMQGAMQQGMHGGMQSGIPGMMAGHPGMPAVSNAMQVMPTQSQAQGVPHGMSPVATMQQGQPMQMHPGMSPAQGMPPRMGQPMLPQGMAPHPHPPPPPMASMMSPRGHPPPAPSPHSAHSGPASPAFDQGGHPVSQSPMPQNVPPQHSQMAVAPQPPPAPMFVPVPPKTQRLLHSEAYLRYIEGLRADSKTVCDFDKNLTIRAEDVPLSHSQKAKLPAHWLANGPGPRGDTLKTLWNLRDLMLNDAVRLSRTYEIEVKLDKY